MTDRERLIMLIMKANSPLISLARAEELAGFLLDNGVIVPPCNVGDTVYRIDDKKVYDWWQITQIQVYADELLFIDDSDNYFVENDIGKTVFLTREEAEKALAERQGKNENLDFKMRERFHRREQDEDRRDAMEFRKLAKMKAAHYAENELFDDEKMRECGGRPEDIERFKKYLRKDSESDAAQ